MVSGTALLLFGALHVHAEQSERSYAYLNATSYAAGETLVVHASTPFPMVQVSVERVGVRVDSMLQIPDLTASSSPIPDSSWILGCNWPALVSLVIPPEWSSGYYQVRILTPYGAQLTKAPFVVRASEATPRTVLMVSAVHTWQAYNAFGGKSLYDYNSSHGRAPRVTFDRPYDANVGLGQMPKYEIPMARWLERSGIPVDYATDVDLSTRPQILNGHRVLLIAGHSEYWSASMYDAVEQFADSGGNVAVLGGNTCMWAVRAEDQARTLVCYKSYADPLKSDHPESTTVQWRDVLLGRPECAFLGVLTPSCEPMVSTSLRFNRTFNWLTAGLEGEVGNFWGSQVLGYEFDSYLPTFSPTLAVPVLQTNVAGQCSQVHTGTYYELQPTFGIQKSGGGIMDVGTVQWSWGLDSVTAAPDPRMQRFTSNLFAGFQHRLASARNAAVILQTVLSDTGGSAPPDIRLNVASVSGDTSAGVAVVLRDDGVWPDTAAGDRLYTGRLDIAAGERFPKTISYVVGPGLPCPLRPTPYFWLEDAVLLDSLYYRMADTVLSCDEVVGAPPRGSAAFHFSVSPNPARGIQRLRWSAEMGVREVTIYDVHGRRQAVLHPSAHSTSVDWDGRAAGGIYWARAVGTRGVWVSRLVRLR